MVVFSLTLVRHGETVANKDGIIQGHQDVALSEAGLTQARLVAFRLRNEKFTHIFTSDLSRAAWTAQIIAEASTVSQCSVIYKDPRLRERRFGVYEGKTFTELSMAARVSNKKWADFTPEGAETYGEVRFRARDFFRDLCEKMAAAASLPTESSTHIPLSDKSSQSVNVDLKSNRTVGFSVVTSNKLAGSEGLNSDAVTAPAGSGHCQWTKEAVAAKRPRTEDPPQLERLSLDGERPLAGVVDADCAFSEGPGAGANTMTCSNSSSFSGCSSLHDSVECPDADLATSTEEEERDTDSSDVGYSRTRRDPPPHPPSSPHHHPSSPQTVDSDGPEPNPTQKKWCSLAGQSAINWLWDGLQPWVRDTDPSSSSVVRGSGPGSGLGSGSGSGVDPTLQTCPNVSLSPLAEHRQTSLSSVSSGRNSSFDDTDILPAVAGDVLVVTHGGFIKELMSHFIEDLHCKVPGGKGHVLRVCPNTGVSRFMVTLGEGGSPPTVTCLLIHDKEHLKTFQEPLRPDYPT
ncbi:hypothetical protein ACOMHN_040159 [Nucella lapillus]